VLLVKLELGRVLDRDDAIGVRNGGRESIEEGGLAGARSARDQDVQLGVDAPLEELDRFFGECAKSYKLGEAEASLAELADRDERPRKREGGQHGVHTASIGKTGIDHRRGLVDAATDLSDDLVDDPAQVGLVGEPD